VADFAVLFDLDGLMLDTERMARQAWTRALNETGFLLDEVSYLRLLGRTVQDARGILNDIFGAELPFDLIFSRRQAYYELDIHENGIPIKPGLHELLAFLEQHGIPKAVASSTPCWFARQKLEHSGLLDRFSAVVCGDDVPRGKPAPDLFLEAARRLDVSPHLCLVLEDSEAGIHAAYSAGMLPVMVPDLKQPSPDVRDLAYRILPDLHSVIPLVESFLREGIPSIA
jgi:HAD superfamily hydrolase (TIGR01509 family)